MIGGAGAAQSKFEGAGPVFLHLWLPRGWQLRNGPIIHDVTSVKYSKENEICTMFSKIK